MMNPNSMDRGQHWGVVGSPTWTHATEKETDLGRIVIGVQSTYLVRFFVSLTSHWSTNLLHVITGYAIMRGNRRRVIFQPARECDDGKRVVDAYLC